MLSANLPDNFLSDSEKLIKKQREKLRKTQLIMGENPRVRHPNVDAKHRTWAGLVGHCRT